MPVLSMRQRRESDLIAARNVLSSAYANAGPGSRQESIGQQIDVLDAQIADCRRRRQSSVVKVTVKSLRWLSAACVDSCGGFIARFKGREYGIVSVIGGLFVTYDGELLEARECCVRRGTVEAIRAEINASLIGAGLCA